MHRLSLLPLAKLKLVWERITASRIAIIYFAFSIFSCTIQVVFQAQGYSINEQADVFLSGLIHKGNATLSPGFFVLDSQLRFCDHVPKNFSTDSCQIVWNGTIADAKVTKAASKSRNSSISHVTSIDRKITASPSPTPAVQSSPTISLIEVPNAHPPSEDLAVPQANMVEYRRTPLNSRAVGSLKDVQLDGKNLTLSHNCLVALNWPVQTLRYTKREDIAFLAFQFWVLGMSLVALLNESIPHIIAAVLTHLSATAWGSFQIYSTRAFHSDFKRLTTDGACHINLLPNYWSSRSRAEIPSLAFNVVALLVSCFLSFRLIKLFGWQTFKRVGASRSINRVYKLVLTLSTVIQLELFFVVTAVALWLDQLYHGAIALMATQSNLYQVFLTIVIILLIPWLLTGWFAARLERKFPMLVFLVLSALYLIGWSLMFDSGTFRWTFVQWAFFGAMASVSAILDLIGFIVGIMCRLNFDKGLSHYLNAEEPLRDSFIQTVPGEGNVSDEKFDFPSTRHPIPTFSVTFGSNNEVPRPDQMRSQTTFNQSVAPFDAPVDIESVTDSTVFPASTRPLARNGSEHSTSSQASSTMTMNAPSIGRSRWVIE